MYIGLDIGTSSVKAVLFDAAQGLVSDRSVELTVSRPHSGWSEQDPDDWWRAVEAVLDSLAADQPRAMSGVRGIGLSGQMHGATLLDASDQPLRPCILWNDGRADLEAGMLDADARVHTGNPAFAGFTAPKLMWAATHEPEVFAKTETILLPKDYVRMKLTGDRATDMSDASGTLWLDVAGRKWSAHMLARCDLDERQMPELYEGTEVTGTVLPDLSARWGMTAGPVIVAAGGGDNAASACGLGTVANGSGFLSLGTSGVIFVSGLAEFAPDKAVHAFCHALPGQWHQMGVMLSAASALDWLAGVVDRPVADLLAGLPASARAPVQPLFLPYLSGERTPCNDVSIRGAFAGLGHETSREEMVQAVLEGVAFGMADCRDALTQEVSLLVAAGGGSRSRYWLSLLANVLDQEIAVPAAGELGAAFGAARLGLIAAENADPMSICTLPQMTETIAPDEKLGAAFRQARGRWQTLYPALKELDWQ